MSQKLNPQPLSLTAAIWSAAVMLLLGVAGNLGIYTGAVEAMQNWHIFFDPSVMGIVGGMIEAAVVSYVGVYAFVWIYGAGTKLTGWWLKRQL